MAELIISKNYRGVHVSGDGLDSRVKFGALRDSESIGSSVGRLRNEVGRSFLRMFGLHGR